MMLKNKPLLYIVIGIILICGILLSWLLISKSNQKIKSMNNVSKEEYNYDEEDALFVEESFDDGPRNLKLEITSPEEEKIFPGQARKYQAKAIGEGNYSNMADCHWDFYLNEYNEEVLYQTMDNRSIVSSSNTEVCGFLDTFMDRIGKLRIVLTMTIHSRDGGVYQTVSAERSYVVAR